ncbi:MAG TPA: hypothetical protein DCY88_06945 [Cyanobacteria bacterium UBA11372]|nr:hypothetical protein [Cyanobacteria bacterium UBA11372]
MKATSSRQPSSVAAGIFQLVGTIMIVSSLIDYAVLLFPPVTPANLNPEQLQLLGLQQTVSVTTQLIDRGIIPMVGLAFLFAGFWIDSNSGATKKGLSAILQPASLALSVILGIAFLALTFVNVNSQRLLNQRTVEQISTRSQQAETQLKDRSQQVAALANDPQRLSELDQALGSGRIQGQQREQLQAIKQQLEQFKQDPKALDQRVKDAQTQIRSERDQTLKQSRQEYIKSSVRSGVSSALLGIGYLGIAWSGVSGLVGGVKAPRR